LFSCQPFFASAWRDLRQGRIGMDLPVALGIGATFALSTVGTLMALFALGTSVSMVLGPWAWLRLARRKVPGAVEFVGQPGRTSGDWGVRLAGLALFASAAWALWMGLVHNTAPWCVPGA